MNMMHYDTDKYRFEIAKLQIKDSYYSEYHDELIADLCVFLQCYGSKKDIEMMEEKYDFDYDEVIKEIKRG